MRFDILNRFTGAVQFTAEINCADDADRSIKVGLAVQWGVKNGADLTDADLTDANLTDANLTRANLYDANLTDANLTRANLTRANLTDANLYDANLTDANLYDANLTGANLYDANLTGADLTGANLTGAHGGNDWIKCIQIDTYPVTYAAEVMQIGCQRHPITDWASFTDAQIRAMDGSKALAWWKQYKDWIFAAIELCPAKPTKEAAQ